MKVLGKIKVGKVKTGEGKYLPQIRLPKELLNLVGKELQVIEVLGSQGISVLLKATDVQEGYRCTQDVLEQYEKLDLNNLESRISSLEQKLSSINSALQRVEDLLGFLAGVAESGKGAGLRVQSGVHSSVHIAELNKNTLLESDNIKNSQNNYIDDAQLVSKIEQRDSFANKNNQNFATIDYDTYRDKFVEYLVTKNIKDWQQYVRDLDKTLTGKVIGHPRELAVIFRNKSKHYKVAIKSFLKFLEEEGYKTASELLDYRNVIKIPKSGIRDPEKAFTTTEKIIEALENTKDVKKAMIIRLLAYSGIRLSEAVEIISNFDESKLIVKENFARYPLHKTKATKRAFYAYMPLSFAKKLQKMHVTETMLKGKKIARGIIYPNQLRKWNAMFLLEHNVPTEIIDFIQGRAPERILQKHYLNIVKLADELYSRIEFPF